MPQPIHQAVRAKARPLCQTLCVTGVMKKIYSLQSDASHIENVQKATLETKIYGIVSEHGLFGSNEWWQALAHGEIEIQTIEGVISEVYMAGHNDFPEFKIMSDGNVTSWERKADSTLYKEGALVKLEYVLTKNRFDNKVSPTQLNVWVQE